VDRKVHYVDRYASIFAVGMRQYPRRAYIELFAGPGLSWDRGHRAFVKGSALRALDFDFTDYVFVDLDPKATAALDERIDRLGARRSKKITVITNDCNAAVDAIRQALPSSHLISLAFVDPTNWQVSFDSIRRLVSSQRVDLLFTFHDGNMRRMVQPGVPRLDAFFGTPEWRQVLKLPQSQVGCELRRLYNRQLQTLGYRPDSDLDSVPVRNTVNRVIYELLLFSKHPRGLDFWRKASSISELGQRSLWDA
jgi:three-Cys-motif partner protein